jgi:hypothetical protein
MDTSLTLRVGQDRLSAVTKVFFFFLNKDVSCTCDKSEIEIALLIREALICIYLPLTPVKCRGKKRVELYP